MIAEAAASLFAEYGFARTTTRMIAAKAGVAEGTIYLYYAGKKDILIRFVEHVILDSVKETFAQTQGFSDEEIVEAFLVSRFRLWGKHRDLMKVLVAEALFDKELAQRYTQQVVQPALGMVREYFARRIADGAFRNIDPTVAARALLGHFLSAAIFSSIFPTSDGPNLTPEQYAHELVLLFLEGMKK